MRDNAKHTPQIATALRGRTKRKYTKAPAPASRRQRLSKFADLAAAGQPLFRWRR